MPSKSIDKVRSDIISQIHTKLADEANYDLDLDEHEQREKKESYKKLLKIIRDLPEYIPPLLVETIKNDIEEDDFFFNYNLSVDAVKEMIEPYKKISKISQGLPSHILSQFIEQAENEHPNDTFDMADSIEENIKNYKYYSNVLSSASAKSLPD